MSSTTSQPTAGGALTGNVLMYSRPEPLNPEQHGRLGVVRSETPFGFAATANAVPVAVAEFGPASLSYPVIFAGEERLPLVVMSIRDNENLFVSADGRFEPEAYIPAFVRRYPFVLANDEGQKRLVVCIDTAAPFVKPEGEVRLFENGKPTEYTENAIQFCQDFETERNRTTNFVERLKQLDLFETKQAFFTPRNEQGQPGEPVQIAEYFAVSVEKLGALPAEVLVELRDTGALQQIYAHINSLLGWDKLIARTIVRAPVEGNA